VNRFEPDNQAVSLARRRLLHLGLAVPPMVLAAACAPTAAAPTSPPTSAAPASSPVPVLISPTSPATAKPAASPAVSPSALASPTGLVSCILTPEETEGPYYFNANMVRRDITEGRPGTPMRLVMNVYNVSNGCQPITNAMVDVWHADAAGAYSGFGSGSSAAELPGAPAAKPSGGPGGPPPVGGIPKPGGGAAAVDPATAQKFMRGIQVTDGSGRSEFATVFPGWYQGRTTHIHFKVHFNNSTAITSQLYFPEDAIRQAYSQGAYASRGQNTTTNANDGVVTARDLPFLTAQMGQSADGLTATLNLGVRV
jgi:protocatechuate 3,4-dioxygenase beta subunit